METRKEIVVKIEEVLHQQKDFSEVIPEIKELKAQFVELAKSRNAEAQKEHDESGSVMEFKVPHDDDDSRFSDLMAQFNQKKKTWEDQRAHELQQNLDAKKKIIEELNKLVETEDHIGPAFEKFNALRDKWKSTGNVPNSEYRDLQREYSHQIDRFFYNINIYKSLKEYDLQKNLQLKQEMIEKVKTLLKNDNIKEIRDLINTYTHEWDEIGPTHQNDWEKVRDEFWENVRLVHKKIADHYKGQKEKIKENKEAKEALCERVEELSRQDLQDVKLWNKANKEVNKIRDEWKKIGFAGKKVNDEVWARFRKAMDTFYAHRKEEQEEMKEHFKEFEEKKLKLIEQAEALKDSMDWRNTANTFKKLQADWKRIPSTLPAREQKLWKKFRAPSDHFFNRRKDYFDNREEREKENLEKKKTILADLTSIDVKDKDKAMQAIQQYIKDWNAIGFVPKDEKSKIENEFHKLQNDKMKEIGMGQKEIEEQAFELKVEGLKDADNAEMLLNNEYRNLNDKLRKIESDIKQYENNLGFFGGNTDNPLVKEVEKKIEKSKTEADKIKARMALLDK